MKNEGGRGRRRALASLSAAVALAVGLPTLALGVSVGEETPVTVFKSRLKPRYLPEKKPAPVSLYMAGRIRTYDGSHPPALRELQIKGDRHLTLDLEDVPSCGSKGVPDTPPPWKRCADAIIGTGKATIEYAYPEHKPIPVLTDLAIYNGGFRNGVTRLWAHGYTPIRFPQAIVVPIKVKEINSGPYGWMGEAFIPVTGEGYGSLLSFDITIHKRVLSARCPDGEHHTQMRASFSNKSVVIGSIVGSCRPRT